MNVSQAVSESDSITEPTMACQLCGQAIGPSDEYVELQMISEEFPRFVHKAECPALTSAAPASPPQSPADTPPQKA